MKIKYVLVLERRSVESLVTGKCKGLERSLWCWSYWYSIISGSLSDAGSRVWSKIHVESLSRRQPSCGAVPGQLLEVSSWRAWSQVQIKSSFSDQVRMPEQEVAKGAKGFSSFLLGFVLGLPFLVQWSFHHQCMFTFSIQPRLGLLRVNTTLFLVFHPVI